jgi:hypothetical protein
MMMRLSLLPLLLCAACKEDVDVGGPVGIEPALRVHIPDTLKGSLTVGGKPAELTSCKVGHHEHVYIDTPLGRLHFEDAKLRWTPRDRSEALLDCKKLDRSWGGGNRADGSSYFRGQLKFECSLGDNAIAGDLMLDCGDISDAERKQLDANRQELLDKQKTP